MAVYLWLVRGAFWRRLRTINHDELAAAVLGIHVGRSKEQVFLIGAAFAAVAGLLRAYYIGLAIPEDGGVDHSLEQLAMVMVGGAGHVFGPIFGTAALQWLFVVTGYAKSYVLLVYGAVFLAAVLYLKDGIAGWVAKGWHRTRAIARRSHACKTCCGPHGASRRASHCDRRLATQRHLSCRVRRLQAL